MSAALANLERHAFATAEYFIEQRDASACHERDGRADSRAVGKKAPKRSRGVRQIVRRDEHEVSLAPRGSKRPVH
jgi:hypothetical protein